jgi:hypothetical protein
LPKLKECRLVVVRSLRAKSLENDFPLFRGVGINAGIGYGKWLKERSVIKIGFHQAVDSRIPEHRSQTAVNDAINAAGFACTIARGPRRFVTIFSICFLTAANAGSMFRSRIGARHSRPSLRHSLSLPAPALYRPTGLKRDSLQRANLEEPSLRHESAAVSVRCQRSRLVQLRVKQPAEPSRQYLHLPGRKG